MRCNLHQDLIDMTDDGKLNEDLWKYMAKSPFVMVGARYKGNDASI